MLPFRSEFSHLVTKQNKNALRLRPKKKFFGFLEKMTPSRHIWRRKSLNLTIGSHQTRAGILNFFLLSSLTCSQIWLSLPVYNYYTTYMTKLRKLIFIFLNTASTSVVWVQFCDVVKVAMIHRKIWLQIWL